MRLTSSSFSLLSFFLSSFHYSYWPSFVSFFYFFFSLLVHHHPPSHSLTLSLPPALPPSLLCLSLLPVLPSVHSSIPHQPTSWRMMFPAVQASKTESSLKLIEDRLEDKIGALRGQIYAGHHPKLAERGESALGKELGPIRSIKEEAKLQREISSERKKLVVGETGGPSLKQKVEEAELGKELEEEREKLASPESSSSSSSSSPSARSRAAAAATMSGGSGSSREASSSSSSSSSSSVLTPEQRKQMKATQQRRGRYKLGEEARVMYYRAMQRYWSSNVNAQFGDWKVAQDRWDSALVDGSSRAPSSTTPRPSASTGYDVEGGDKMEGKEGTGMGREGGYGGRFGAWFARGMDDVGVRVAGDTVARATYLCAEHLYFAAHPAAGREDWHEARAGYDASAPPAMLSWKEGSETAVYSEEAQRLYERAHEQEAHAREAYYRAEEAYWRAHGMGGYQEWKKSQEEWDRGVAEEGLSALGHASAPPSRLSRLDAESRKGTRKSRGGQFGDDGNGDDGRVVEGDGYRQRFLSRYSTEIERHRAGRILKPQSLSLSHTHTQIHSHANTNSINLPSSLPPFIHPSLLPSLPPSIHPSVNPSIHL